MDVSVTINLTETQLRTLIADSKLAVAAEADPRQVRGQGVSNWLHRVEIVVGEKSPAQVARVLANLLLLLPADFRALEHGLTTLDEIIDWLEVEASNQTASGDDVDTILRELYDWGYENRLCVWVFLGTAPSRRTSI